MAIDKTGAISLSEFKFFIEQLSSKEEEEKTEEADTVEEKNTSVFGKTEIGGNGANQVSTVEDVDALLNKINNVVTVKSKVSFADVEKTRNSLINKKADIQYEQDETEDKIINKFTDTVKFGKELSNNVKSLIEELHDEKLKNSLMSEYNSIKDSIDKEEKPRLNYIN